MATCWPAGRGAGDRAIRADKEPILAELEFQRWLTEACSEAQNRLLRPRVGLGLGVGYTLLSTYSDIHSSHKSFIRNSFFRPRVSGAHINPLPEQLNPGSTR